MNNRKWYEIDANADTSPAEHDFIFSCGTESPPPIGEPFADAVFIADALTIEQVQTTTNLYRDGNIIPGSYGSWEAFALIHGIE